MFDKGDVNPFNPLAQMHPKADGPLPVKDDTLIQFVRGFILNGRKMVRQSG